jgi:hypothetical protein
VNELKEQFQEALKSAKASEEKFSKIEDDSPNQDLTLMVAGMSLSIIFSDFELK